MIVVRAAYWIPILSFIWRLDAQPVVYQATGTREQVQAAVAQFEHDIVYGPNADAEEPALTLGTYQLANLDIGQPDPAGYPNYLIFSGGLLLSAVPGAILHVVNTGGLAITSISPTGFDSFWVTNPRYPDEFHQNAFGAVFANVPSGFAALDFGYRDGTGYWLEAPPAVAGQFSFLGIINPQQDLMYSLVQMKTAPSYPPYPVSPDAPLAHDIILGQAVPLPESTSFHLLMIAAVVAGMTWLGAAKRLHRRRSLCLCRGVR